MQALEAEINVPAECLRASRKPRPLPFTALISPEFVTDEVLVLRLPKARSGSCQHPERFPGKRYSVTSVTAGTKLPYNRSSWFDAKSFGIGDVDSLHAACELARLGDGSGPGCLVPGTVAPGADARSLPRSKTSRPSRRDAQGCVVRSGRPVGLVDAHRHWRVLDLDGVPSGGIDPRRDPVAALERLRAFLPPAQAGARLSWQWSASTCVRDPRGQGPLGERCPATVGIHFRYWSDVALDEAGRKAETARVAAYVAAMCPGALVDQAVAIYNQAIFCAASFEEGLADPFPGALRSGILDGALVVSASELERQLPALAPKPSRKPSSVESAAREGARAASAAAGPERREHDRILRAAGRMRGAADKGNVVPFPAFAAPRGFYGRGREASIRRRQDVFRRRALQDIGKLVEGRRETDDAWRDGLPDGMRHKGVNAYAALLSFVVPAAALPAAIERAVRSLASSGWVEERWLPRSGGSWIVAAAMMAEAAQRAGQDDRGLRVDRCKTALMNLFAPDRDEQFLYGLQALRGAAAKSDAERRSKGTPERHEYLASCKAKPNGRHEPWKAMGIGKTRYYALVKADPSLARPRPADVAALAPTQAPCPVAGAAPQAADVASHDVSRRGLELVAAAVRLAWNPHDGEAAIVVASGSGMGDVSGPAADRDDMREVFVARANAEAKGPRAAATAVLSRGLAILAGVFDGESPAMLAAYLIAEDGMGVAARARAAHGPKIASLAEVQAELSAAPDCYSMPGIAAALLDAATEPRMALAA